MESLGKPVAVVSLNVDEHLCFCFVVDGLKRITKRDHGTRCRSSFGAMSGSDNRLHPYCDNSYFKVSVMR